MNVQHILNRGRQLAESLMTDQCRVTHMGKPLSKQEQRSFMRKNGFRISILQFEQRIGLRIR